MPTHSSLPSSVLSYSFFILRAHCYKPTWKHAKIATVTVASDRTSLHLQCYAHLHLHQLVLFSCITNYDNDVSVHFE